MSNQAKLRLLVIDDDPLVVDTIALCLPEHWDLVARDRNQIGKDDFFHAALVDVHLTGSLDKTEGFDVMKKLSKQSFSEVVAMSGDLRRDIMESALKAGATRFLAKPLSADELGLVLEKIETLWSLRGVSVSDKSSDDTAWIGQSKASDEIRRFVANMKNEKAPILIEGESGTGKEVVAQLIHQSQRERPFVAINVAALSENLFESEVFGHVKGSFTGAVQNKVGLVERAHGGDLFLDELEALSLSHQAKLLRFIESGEFQKVGATETQFVQVRIIAATNEKLDDLVTKGKFREDLMYRLSGHKLTIPPLRERKEDIKELCQFFLGNREVTMKKTMGEDAVAALEAYSWPGNVRQLKRICEHLSLMAPLPIIRAEDVARSLVVGGSSSTSEEILLDKGLQKLLEDYEKRVMVEAIKLDLDVDDLAKKLKISRSSLYKKVKDHSLELKK